MLGWVCTHPHAHTCAALPPTPLHGPTGIQKQILIVPIITSIIKKNSLLVAHVLGSYQLYMCNVPHVVHV